MGWLERKRDMRCCDWILIVNRIECLPLVSSFCVWEDTIFLCCGPTATRAVVARRYVQYINARAAPTDLLELLRKRHCGHARGCCAEVRLLRTTYVQLKIMFPGGKREGTEYINAAPNGYWKGPIFNQQVTDTGYQEVPTV